jgi:hypothetical protein
MNVGKWGVLGMAIAMTAMLGQARAEHSRPSQETLKQMGLGGMVVMSDADAARVRGQGYQPKKSHSSVRVWGNSFATINGKNGSGGAHSENGYAVQGKHFAAGVNGSVAGVVKIKGRHISSTTFFAGGFSAGVGF